MQLQNFECQIAKAQIGRYVAGDKLSDEAVEQLEAHVAKCPDCKQNLAERRAVLQAMLSPGEASVPSQQETPEEKKSRFDLGHFIRAKVQHRQPVQAVVQTSGAKPSSFTKPAMYSLALGAVLIGMSYASKNMGSVWGPKAAEGQVNSAQAKPLSPTEKPTATKLKPKSISGSWTKPLTKSAPPKVAVNEPSDLPLTPPKPKTKKPAKTKPSKTHPSKNSSEHKTKRSHHKPRHAENSIRVYEPEN